MRFVPQSKSHYIPLGTRWEEFRGSGTGVALLTINSQWPIFYSFGSVFILPEPQPWFLLARLSAHCWSHSTYKGLEVPENLCSPPFPTSAAGLGYGAQSIAPLSQIGTALRLSLPSGPPLWDSLHVRSRSCSPSSPSFCFRGPSPNSLSSDTNKTNCGIRT